MVPTWERRADDTVDDEVTGNDSRVEKGDVAAHSHECVVVLPHSLSITD